MGKIRPIHERFWPRVAPGPNGCLLWQGSDLGHGYGGFSIMGRTVYAHRVAWELARGPLPPGVTLDHICRNRRCVNVEHLETVTFRENVRRGVGPTAINGRRQYCVHGHELTGANLILRSNGHRECRECLRRRSRDYQSRRRAAQRGLRADATSPAS